MKILSRLYIALILFFLYAPVAVMIIFSFNSSSSVWVFEGFSTKWYEGLVYDTTMLTALEHTLIIAMLSALISTVLGTAAAVGILAIRKKVASSLVMSMTNIPMMNADIVTGVSLNKTSTKLTIGDTDALWWKRICLELKRRSNLRVIVYSYSAPKEGRDRSEYLLHERTIRERIVSFGDFSDAQKEEFVKRIYVTGTDIFHRLASVVKINYDSDKNDEKENEQEFERSNIASVRLVVHF